MTENYDLYISVEEQMQYQDSSFDNDYFLSNMNVDDDVMNYQSLSIHKVFNDFLSNANKTWSLKTDISNSIFDLNETIDEKQLLDDILNQKQKHQYETLVKTLELNINAEIQFLIDEEVELPNDSVKDFSQNVIYFLAYHSIYPEKLTITVEGGICLVFYNESERLYLELYNEGDIGYIIEDKKNRKLIENKNLNSLNEIIQRLKKFYF